MQTPSHFLLTAVLARTVPKPPNYFIHKTALLLGSILPDVPFALLTAAYGIYFRWLVRPPTSGTVMEYLHFDLFYTDPVWIIGQNFFHSLLINVILLGLGLWGGQLGLRWARPLLWLSVGMLFHTLIDLFTHHTDGPLIFFPLDWTYRFPSPISYWEPAYYGRQFTVFEYALDAVIIAYFVWLWFKNKVGTADTGL